MDDSAVVASDKQPDQPVPEKEFRDFGFLERAVGFKSDAAVMVGAGQYKQALEKYKEAAGVTARCLQSRF